MLRYNGAMSGENQSLARVLSLRDLRVEIHVLPLENDSWTVMALSGAGGVERRKGQGPFPSRESAVAVAARIAAALRAQGFVSLAEPPCWEMDAWRDRRRVLSARRGFVPRTAFHPDDVIF